MAVGGSPVNLLVSATDSVGHETHPWPTDPALQAAEAVQRAEHGRSRSFGGPPDGAGDQYA